jgi:hypothetical protein
MKNSILSAALLAMTITSANAQDQQVRIKMKKTEVPVAVVESFSNDFNGEEAVVWVMAPTVIAVEDYEISGYNNLDDSTGTAYSIMHEELCPFLFFIDHHKI